MNDARAKILDILLKKGWAPYLNCATSVDLAVKQGVATELEEGQSYFIYPLVGDGKDPEQISSFVTQNDIQQPALVMQRDVIFDHDFGDDQGDESVFKAGAPIPLNGFRIENRMIVVIFADGRDTMHAREFVAAIETLPDINKITAKPRS